MTLLPAENRDVHGLDGPAYPRIKTGPVCAHPLCSRFSDHAHHLWRRSFLGGDFHWVKLWDGTIVCNMAPLCWQHHDLITRNVEGIIWRDGKFVWIDNTSKSLGELFPQPAVHGKPQPVVHTHEPFEGPAAGEVCPGCKRTIPRKKQEGEKTETARRRKTWTISVPDDGEDGALVLDTLLEICAELFQHDEAKSMRYFTTVQALALVAQHGHALVNDAQNAA